MRSLKRALEWLKHLKDEMEKESISQATDKDINHCSKAKEGKCDKCYESINDNAKV
ncbi:MAG: hypothetical protein AAB116_11190 [Candidatus Poribacteria bacterium]